MKGAEGLASLVCADTFVLHCLRCLHTGRGNGGGCSAWRDRARETGWAACRGLSLLCGRSLRP
eukprot:9909027-Alexandrium_andersonii.AAC.1